MRRPGSGGSGRWVPVAVATCLGLLVALALTLTTRTTYAATTTSFVSLAGQPLYGSGPETDPFAGSQFVLQRMNTYAGLAVTPEVLGAVIDDLGLTLTPGQLAGKVTSTATPNSVLLSVAVSDADASRATAIANAVAGEQARVIERSESAGGLPNASPVRVTVIDAADVERGSLLPRPVSIALGGLVTALLVLGAVALGRRYAISQRARHAGGYAGDPADDPIAWLGPAAAGDDPDALADPDFMDDHRERVEGDEPDDLPDAPASVRAS